MTLDGIEKVVEAGIPFYCKGTTAKNGVMVIRYADDFIVSAQNRNLLVEKVLPSMVSFTRENKISMCYRLFFSHYSNTDSDLPPKQHLSLYQRTPGGEAV